jgi:hypothetical protein
MTAHTAGVCLCLLGLGVVVLCPLVALLLHRPLDRLRLLSPMTTLGTPLATLGLALRNGWSLPSAQILVTGLLVALTGPAMTSASGRVIGMQEGKVPQETPE